MVTGLFAGQHNTKLHGTITGVILDEYVYHTVIKEHKALGYAVYLLVNTILRITLHLPFSEVLICLVDYLNLGKCKFT